MNKYDGRIQIEIWNNDEFLACTVRQKVGHFGPYCGEIYRDALDWVSRALYNYNRNLISVKDNIPREIFALRFVEQTDAAGKDGILTPTKSPMAKKALKAHKSYYSFKNRENPWAWISFDKEETERIMGGRIPLKVYVDISKKIVFFNNFITKMDDDKYCSTFGVSKSDIGNIKRELSPCPVIVSQVNFNMMDELREVLDNNKRGFIASAFLNGIEVLK